MNAGDIVYTALTTNAGVAALVSTRIYPVDAPLDVDLPACYYEVQLTEATDGSAPISGAQVSVGCLAHEEATANSLADAVDAVLNGMTKYTSGTWLRGLYRLGRTASRDAESNLWGVLLVYGAQVTF